MVYVKHMSATTEKLLEQIELTTASLEECRKVGDKEAAQHLESVLADFKKRLSQANEALNEGKQVLKG